MAISDITFVVPGQAVPGGARRAGAPGIVKTSVRVGAQRGADAAAAVRVSARPGVDVVVLTIANGPTLVLHPEDARDLMHAQSATATRGGFSAGADVIVPMELAWPGPQAGATRDGAGGATRGGIGQAVLSALEVVTGLVADPAAKLAAAAVTAKVDGAVDEGVYRLDAAALPATLKGSAAKLASVPAAADGGPLLVLIHGTFVDTVSTFGKLWALHPQAVQALFAQYRDRVYALDHPTLGASPIANALALAKAAPAGARLHLVTHSRGGLVAEVLARACGGALADADLALFAGAQYARHRADLQALVKVAQTKQLKVERMVRVACPARGTLLASKRLDAYLSVLQWSLQLAGVPVLPQLVDFLHEVARRRADPASLPGLEAMMPASAVVQWLNRADAAIPGDLRVVAGDMQGDSVVSWVKTLLTDAFYWTDNDIVVQTRSMYGGAPRAAGATFLLDRGADVSHFNYFANERSVAAIVGALGDALPSEFATIGPLSWSGEDASGTRGAPGRTRDAAANADRPAVFVLPGILGSNLALDGKRVWLGLRFINGLMKLAWDPATAARFTPDGPIGSSYDALIAHLGASHEVIPFAYDWRRPIEDEARRLADAVDTALAARSASGQPVRLLAHSMGGLVARTMQLERPETWRRMMARDGARLLMLGTPNGGSWSPMQTLSGDDTFGNALVAFGALFDNGGARKMMAAMPGFLQLQAGLLDPALGLAQAAAWQKLADDDLAALRARSIWHDEGAQRTIYEWGAPPQPVLDQAVALRRRLDAQLTPLAADAPKMALVIGHASFTPNGIMNGVDGLEYVDAPDGGDGRVPLASALLAGVRTWKVDAEHGKLPDVAGAFDAYVELLAGGTTGRLEAYQPAPAVRGGVAAEASVSALARRRPSRGWQASQPPSSAADVLGAGAAPVATATAARDGGGGAGLCISVLNGDLKFIGEPLMLGHYRALKLTGTEAVVDGLVASAMTRSLDAGLYPDRPGSHKIFGNLRPDPDNVFAMARPEAAVVVGLGEEGKLEAADVVMTVRQAVIAYAQRVAERNNDARAPFRMAATLIASGGTGISAGSAAQLIAQGALEANAKLAGGGWPLLERLTLVELFLERASDAWRALKLQQQASGGLLQVDRTIRFGPGALRRPLDSSYRGSSYDFISAVTTTLAEGQASIGYTLDTRRARAEVRAQKPQATLLRELVKNASNDANHDPLIGRTLFNLLVPVELEPFLAGSAELLLELDSGTAGIPWELLDTDAGASVAVAPPPWAIRSKLLRKLRVENFRPAPTDASADDRVLVIGEPLTDALYPPLPGARAEAQAVVALLSGALGDAERVRALVHGDDARTVINALFEQPYRIVHVAGHGKEGAHGGVVLSGKNTYLGACEVDAMRVVPELVFLNCCHLAARELQSTLVYDRAAFAANIAEALIKLGVRCVIAAGWAVEDEPAETFATTFYGALLGGQRFIDAVAAAREAAWRAGPGGNTWAAYQCYGDPEWFWRRRVGDAQHAPALPGGDEFGSIASPVGLALALENLATGSRYSKRQSDHALQHVELLEERFGALWGEMGAVAEAFGLAYAEAHAREPAIRWYRVAIAAADGSASFRAAEQLGNQLVRQGQTLAEPAAARRAIEEGIALLTSVARLHPTLERESLLGSAYKRLVMVEAGAGDAAAVLSALQHMARRYAAAEGLAGSAATDNLFYPAKNGISADLRLAFLEGRPPRLDAQRLARVRASLDRAATDAPDFWSVVGQIELRVLEVLAQGRLASAVDAVVDALRKLKARVPAPGMWDSVYNEAQFTLQPYQAIASAAEVDAAAALLAALQGFATPPPSAGV